MKHERPAEKNEFDSMTDFAMSGIDFQPIRVGVHAQSSLVKGEDDLHFHSGSIRDADAYSAILGTYVGVREVYVLVSNIEGKQLNKHKLIVDYDDIHVLDEICLDTGNFLEEERGDKTFDRVTARDRVMKALSAVAELRLGID